MYPGSVLRRGQNNENVRALQTYLNKIAEFNDAIPSVSPTGYFGQETQRAVIAFQRAYGLPVRGVVGLSTWNAIAELYNDIILGEDRSPGQYPGYPLSQSQAVN